ncbi:MAG: hypothetical protein ABI581_14745, partial [Sediminibacterium sp.]
MLFNSFVFIGLLLITLGLYYIPRVSKFQVQLLILSSLVFYAYGQPALVLLLLFSAGLNVIVSYYIATGKTAWRKTWVTTGVLL